MIVVEHADSLVGRVIDGEQARELIGNVRFSQERVRVTCDRALQFIDRGLVELRGNVVVRDDSITLEAPFGLYHRDGRRGGSVRRRHPARRDRPCDIPNRPV